ncbi:MAG TPA: NUDIX hydrolase [Bacilli bacterium]|nr:NUDIX hydrolase [Bacilli bacterium]
MSSYIDERVANDSSFSLPIISEKPDALGRMQLFCYATSVFLRTPEGKYIAMHQTKSNRVVGDNIVGIGGKMEIKINPYIGKGEKISSELIISSLLSGKLSAEDVATAATREVFEETGGYNKDGTLSGEGIKLIPRKLQSIGVSDVRLCNKNSNEVWYISYYVYDLDGTEGVISQSDLREGTFAEYTYEELMQQTMFPADRISLQNMDSNIHTEAIYDDIEGVHKLRISKNTPDSITTILIPDYNNDYYIGEINFKKPLEQILENRGLKDDVIQLMLKDKASKELLVQGLLDKRTFYYPEYIELTPFARKKADPIK